MAPRARALLVLPLILALGAPAAAAGPADPSAPVSETFGYSPYETETIAMVLERLHARAEPAPDGKIIEGIDVVRLEVFEHRDPVPYFLNAFHATSKEWVIRREVLQDVGDKYDQLLVDETARNLRSLPQLSLVLTVAVKGSSPGKVRLVVITKDVWSLRLQWDIILTNGGLERLVLQPAETNLLGIHHTLGANFLYQPLSTSLGAYYVVPRFGRSRVEATASGNVVVDNTTGSPEGSFGGATVAQPLWSTRTPWAWSATAQWRNEITRRYSEAALATYDSPLTPQKDGIPYEYHSDLALAEASVTRSFGWKYKNDFVLSFQALHRSYSTLDLSGFDPAAVAQFRATRVPMNDDRVGPALQWRTYTNDFARVLDLETLGLQEDVRLGHYLGVKVYPVSQNLGSTRTFLGVFAEAGYTAAIKDGIFRVDVQNTTEANTTDVLQGVFDAETYFATPRFGIGRLIWAGRFIDRYADYLNQVSYVGANSVLRGYPSNFFVGKNVVASNLEYRSRPLEILKVQVGGVLFYDAASAFDDWSQVVPRHAVGFGVRALLPQFDRIVFRADLGFPISASPLPAGVGPVTFYVTFAQALEAPQFGPPSSSIGALLGSTSR